MESGKAQLSVINAWKEQKITKVTNKTEKKLLEISAWEKKQTTKIESQLANTQRKMDSKKKEKAEKLRSKKAAVHAKAQEKKAWVQTDALKRSSMQKTKLLRFKPRDRFPTSHLAAASDIICINLCCRLSPITITYTCIVLRVFSYLLVLVMEQIIVQLSSY
ncbi:hypothetical protein Bca52824_044335 [Brassica carinata]|uniref:Remorin C-terminal domain-containing protein n=1 Tax=Brassica carinata TaxID=52824 RepID=A0A8X7V2X1_BRACI|nr:hypothetical protein Bca52824_044335 [Brassica carinata]